MISILKSNQLINFILIQTFKLLPNIKNNNEILQKQLRSPLKLVINQFNQTQFSRFPDVLDDDGIQYKRPQFMK